MRSKSKKGTPNFKNVGRPRLIQYRDMLQTLFFCYEGCPELDVLRKCLKDVQDAHTEALVAEKPVNSEYHDIVLAEARKKKTDPIQEQETEKAITIRMPKILRRK